MLDAPEALVSPPAEPVGLVTVSAAKGLDDSLPERALALLVVQAGGSSVPGSDSVALA